MKSTKRIDVYEAIKTFQEKTLANKPPVSQMIHEVGSMNFKIRPVTGNIAALDLQNEELINALWSLGKLDEFYRKESKNIAAKDKHTFSRMVNELRWNFQNQLSSVRLGSAEQRFSEEHPSFEAEIFKDNRSVIN